MPDREKVIKGLECCTSEQACKGCPYSQSETGHLCSFNCIHDALALLKEQEAVKPLMAITGWVCGRCGHLIAKDNERLPDRCDVCGTIVGGLT